MSRRGAGNEGENLNADLAKVIKQKAMDHNAMEDILQFAMAGSSSREDSVEKAKVERKKMTEAQVLEQRKRQFAIAKFYKE